MGWTTTRCWLISLRRMAEISEGRFVVREPHAQSSMKVQSDVEVATTVFAFSSPFFLRSFMFVLTSMVGSLSETVGVLEQFANVNGGQAGLGVRWCAAVLDELLPHLASLFADEGLELVNHQRRNAVQEHPSWQGDRSFLRLSMARPFSTRR